MNAKSPARAVLSTSQYVDGILSGDRAMLGRAITLIESRNTAHRNQAQDVLQAVLPHTGKAARVGITGVPGVGKSTTIEALGGNLTAAGHKVSVLAVDPTSSRTGGSILGDKTRMAELAVNPNAFIRPSPSSGTLGGVARRTRETMFVCEAAGFDVIIVETVGIGQSETTVADMVDFFLVLMLPGAGDDLQGIKKGVLEIADMIAVNKSDGDNVDRARHAAADYRAAFNILTPATPNWRPPVLTVSGKENRGLDKLWQEIERHRGIMTSSGDFEKRRSGQQIRWMWSMLEERLLESFRNHRGVAQALAQIEEDVGAGRLTATNAVSKLLSLADV